MNSRHIAELIEKGELNEVKDAMENSMVPGSQTFEQALYQLYKNNTITLDEALANADSANNLQQVINNAAAPSPGGGCTRPDKPAAATSDQVGRPRILQRLQAGHGRLMPVLEKVGR
jgi:twitching motility protein PilU